MSNPDKSVEQRPVRQSIGRRQLLKFAGEVAATSVLAISLPESTGNTPQRPIEQTQNTTPTRIVAADWTPTVCEKPSIPFRTREQALLSYANWQKNQRPNPYFGQVDKTDLGKVLKHINLADNPYLGAVNSHLGIAENIPHLPATVLVPFNPFTSFYLYNGEQFFPLAANRGDALGYRFDKPLDLLDRELYDQTIGMRRRIIAVLEIVNDLTDAKTSDMAEALADLMGDGGVIVVGNETNDPAHPNWDNFPRLYRSAKIIKEVLQQKHREDILIGTPGVAYFGKGEYLAGFLEKIKNQIRIDHQQNPFDVCCDHFYGPLETKDSTWGLLARIKSMDQIKAEAGFSQMPYYLTEFGYPGKEVMGQELDDKIQVSCWLFQAIALLSCAAQGITNKDEANNSLVNLYSYHAFLDRVNPNRSLVRIVDSKKEDTQSGQYMLRPNDGVYNGFVLAGKLFAENHDLRLEESDFMVRVLIDKQYEVIWANTASNSAYHTPQGEYEVYDAFGHQLLLDRQGIKLPPCPNAYMGGPVRIVRYS
ncbi:hypothetical protein M1563_04410 [Patescibacteria group bacterium]|nr:hypothetical protein [Patescibacteria group bacterium]